MRKAFPVGRRCASGLILLAAAITGACAEDRIAGPRFDPQIAAQLRAMGFDPAEAVIEGGNIIVEEDIVLALSDLTSLTRQAQAKNDHRNRQPTLHEQASGQVLLQYVTNTIVSKSVATNILFDLSALSGNSTWQNLARDAMDLITDIDGVAVNLVEGSPAAIKIVFTSLGGLCGRAKFPVSGNPGDSIFLDTSAGCSTSNNRIKWMIAHEIGHTLGFRHTNWAAVGESVNMPADGAYGANQVPGTPTTDANSFMHNASPVGGYSDFSTHDYFALFQLWPDTTAVTVTYPSNVPNLSWTSKAGATAYSAYLVSDGQADPCNYPDSCWQQTHWNGDNFNSSSSSLSAADPDGTYTGTDFCQWYLGGPWGESYTTYHVYVDYPKGWTVSRRPALVNGSAPGSNCW
jgi:hypothetical protein